MQIKNRSAKFYPSVIGKAVRKMFLQFMSNRDSSYILHYHFADQPPGTSRLLAPDELNGLLSGQFDEVDQNLKLQFSKSFCINFSENYETQFKSVLRCITTDLGAKDSIEVLSCHAILHAS